MEADTVLLNRHTYDHLTVRSDYLNKLIAGKLKVTQVHNMYALHESNKRVVDDNPKEEFEKQNIILARQVEAGLNHVKELHAEIHALKVKTDKKPQSLFNRIFNYKA